MSHTQTPSIVVNIIKTARREGITQKQVKIIILIQNYKYFGDVCSLAQICVTFGPSNIPSSSPPTSNIYREDIYCSAGYKDGGGGKENSERKRA